MKYQKAIEILTSQEKFCIRLGLERIKSLMEIYNNPQDKIRIIHIAGTNGKGSVSSILANILKCSGYKVGLYTSPHLIDYTERIQINNNPISKENFAQYVFDICKHNIELTEFEVLTAAAFNYFYDNKVDYAIIETGLGGRFDATNICTLPILEIITSISLDHTDRLGTTIEDIASEKAGIIKENSNVITASNNLGYNTIKTIAKMQRANLITSENNTKTIYENKTNYAIINGKKTPFGLLGLYQEKNLALVLKAAEFLKLSQNAVKNGIKTVKWPARLEYIKEKNILIDGAHNPDAAFELKKSLDYYFKNEKRIFIYSSLTTKDYKAVAKTLFAPDDEIYFYEFSHKNALSFEEFKSSMPELNIQKYTSDIIRKDCLKIVTGSLYMIGEFRKISLNKLLF